MLEDILIRKRPRMQKLEQVKKFYDQKNIPNNVVLGTKQAYGKGRISGKFNFDGKRKVIFIAAPQGVGKSVLASRFVEELYHKFGVPFLWIDPQHEFVSHKRPLRSDYAKRYGLLLHDEEIVGRPMGLKDTVVITPYSLKDAVDEVGLLSSIHLSDFLNINDKNLANSLLMELLEIQDGAFSAARRQFSILIEQMNVSSPSAQTFENLRRKVDRYMKRHREGQKVSYVIFEKLESLLRGKQVQVEGTISCDIWKYLADGKNVILQTSLNDTKITVYDIQITLMILSILQNMSKENFPNGVGIFGDEIEKIVSRERKKSSLRQLMIDIPLKFRKKKVWLVGVTQSPEFVHPALINQSNFLIFSNMTRQQMKYLIDNSKMGTGIYDHSLELHSSDPPNVEWLMASPFHSRFSGGTTETEFQTFFALPSRGQYSVVTD